MNFNVTTQILSIFDFQGPRVKVKVTVVAIFRKHCHCSSAYIYQWILITLNTSVRFVCPSMCPDTLYNQVLLRSFLITYNSAATDQKLFIFGMGVPGRVLVHSTSMDPWVMPQGMARDQNLGHPNKVVHVYCSLFIQTTSY